MGNGRERRASSLGDGSSSTGQPGRPFMLFRDALLRLLPSTVPRAFEAMDEDEQAWRGRVFLMTWALSGDETVSWAMALNTDSVHEADVRETVRQSNDEDIRQAVITRRDEMRASSRLGIGDLR